MEIYVKRERYRGPIQGAVLDWAGTAVDFGCLAPLAVFVEVFQQNDVEITIAEAREPMGLQKRDHIAALCAHPEINARWSDRHGRPPDDTDIDAMYARTEPMMIAAAGRHADLIPGLLEFQSFAREHNMSIGSCTGYTRKIMEPLIERARQQGYIPDSIVTPDEVPAGRPYPYMCYANAIRMQRYPFEAMLKIGDTVADVEEGLNAGMWTIAVTDTGNEMGLSRHDFERLDPSEQKRRRVAVAQKLLAAGAHYVVDSIADCIALVSEIEVRLKTGDLPAQSINGTQ